MELKQQHKKSLFRLIALAMAVCMLGSAFLEKAASAASSPADIRGAWSERILLEWMDKGWLTGYPGGTVKPKLEVTRAEFFSLANKSLGFVDEAAISFSDVKPGTWKAKQAAIAVQAGYAEGYPEGTMQPDRKITREEVSVMVAKAFELKLSPEETAVFKDAASISNAGKGAVGALVANGILKGYLDGTFRPKKVITREEAVVILDGALKKLERVSDKARTFSAAGDYGPASGTETIAGNAVIAASGITLRNMEIKGDLLLSAGIGEGEATLDNVKIKGTVTVNGGGPNSIYLKDSQLESLIVDKKDGNIRIAAKGSTTVKRVDLRSGAKLESEAAKDKGFRTVYLTKEMPAGSKASLKGEFAEANVASSNVELELLGGTIQELNVLPGAAGNTMKLEENTQVGDLTLEEEASVQGKGAIDRAILGDRAKDSKFERTPGKLEGGGSPIPSPSPSPSGGGSGSGGGNQDTTPPAAPVVEGVQDQGIYVDSVNPNWSDAPGTTSTATLIKNGSDKVSYTRNTDIAGDGSYILSVTTVKSSNGMRAVTTIQFMIDSVPPTAPRIEGVANGGRYFSVLPDWTDAPNTVSEAMISQHGHGAKPYERGTRIEEDGDYVLTVTAKKANGLTAATTVRFSIDSSAAIPAVLEGVEEGGTYASVIVAWIDVSRMNSTATLAKDGGEAAPFQSGTEITEEGDYVLTVTTQNVLSNETMEQQIHFTINHGAPNPVQILVEGNVRPSGEDYYSAKLYWADPAGTTSTALLKKDDEQPIPYEMNSLIDQDGDYVLTVTSTKLSNGLTATAVWAFKVVTHAQPPTVTGFENNGIYLEPVTMSWELSPGEIMLENSLENVETGEIAENTPNPTTLTADGTYQFELLVGNGGEEIPFGYQFVITGIRGAEDGQSYESVTPTWVDPIGFGGDSGSEAVLSKNGEPAEPYSKGTTIEEEGEYELTVTWRTRNGNSATQSASFKIISSSPSAPNISILGGARSIGGVQYYYSAIPHWVDPPGTSSTATLKVGDADPVPLVNRNAIEDDGDYEVTVTWTNLSTGLTSTRSQAFKVHIGAARPTLSGIEDKGIYFEPVTISWTPRERTVINWTRLTNRNTNERIDDVPNPTAIVEDGEYEFVVEVSRDNEIREYTYSFIIVGIHGVEDKGVYTDGVTPDWFVQSVFSNSNHFTLYKNNERILTYKRGDTISEPGEYVLTVNWLVYDSHSWQIARFTILEPVEVTGVEHGGTYVSAAPTWADAPPGRTIRATLAKDGGEAEPYARGIAISEDGSYVLTLTTRINSSGHEVQQAISFTIDSVPPDEATIVLGGNYRVLSGVTAYYAASLTWTEPAGTTSTAMLRKDGAEPVPYTMGALIDQDGDYELTVTTTKLSNGLTSTAVREFHVSARPAEPALSGFSDNAILLSPTEIAWTSGEGTTIDWVSLLNMSTNERNDAPSSPMTLEQSGEYEFSVGVRKGIEIEDYSYRFIVAGISDVENNGVYTDHVTPGWFVPETLGEVEATLQKGSAPALPYTKGMPITVADNYVLTVTWSIGENKEVTASKAVSFRVVNSLRINIIGGSRIINGEYHYYNAMVDWTEPEGKSGTAMLKHGDAAPIPWQKRGVVDKDGEYEVTVTWTDTSTGETSTSSHAFKVHSGPAAPIVSGIKNQEIYNRPVTFSWTPFEKTTIESVSLTRRDTGEVIATSPSERLVIDQEGEYEFKIKVRRDNETAEYTYQFMVAWIRGVESYEKHSSVTPDWFMPSVYSTATPIMLQKDGKHITTYKRGDTITEAGSYILTVTWRLNTSERSQGVRFEVGPDFLEPIEVTGIEPHTTYESTAAAMWTTESPDVYASAWIIEENSSKRVYTKGAAITKEGNHVLEVYTYSRTDPSRTNVRFIRFTIAPGSTNQVP